MLAEAYDAEELEDLDRYNESVSVALAFNAPKKLKKHKWQSIDKAGTQPLRDGKAGVAYEMAGIVAPLLASGKVLTGDDPVLVSDTDPVEEFAKHTGRKVIYQDGKGGFIDKEGHPCEKTSDCIVSRRQILH